MTKTLATRRSHFRGLYDGRLASVSEFTRGGVSYLQPLTADGKPIGRALKQNADSHRLLAKEYPSVFPTPTGYTFSQGNKRLVPTKKANITYNFKAEDFKRYGFPTRKAGEQFIKDLRKKEIFVKSLDDLKKVINIRNISKSLMESDYFKRQDDKYSKRIVGIFRKKLGRFVVKQNKTPYKGFNATFDVKHIGVKNDIYRYFKGVSLFLYEKIFLFLRETGSCKFQFSLNCQFYRVGNRQFENREIIRTDITIMSQVITILNKRDIMREINNMAEYIIKKIDKFTKEASGWTLEKILYGYLNLVKFQPISGSSYFELDDFIKNKKAVINIKNNDDRCFLYSLIVALHYDELDTKKLDRLYQFEKFFNKYPFDATDMPMTVGFSNKIRKYEDMIKRNIDILYYENGTKEVRPFYSTDNTHKDSICLMLCHSKEESKNHFVCVRSVSRLLSQEVNKTNNPKVFCMRCFSHFSSKEKLDQHKQLCDKNEASKIEMAKTPDLHFTNVKKMLKVPFVVYGDFESIIMPDRSQKGDKTIRTSKHVACGSKYIIVSSLTNKVIKTFLYRGENCVRVMLENLMKDCEGLYYEYFKHKKDMIMTKDDWKVYNESEVCHICKKGGFVSKEEREEYWGKNKKPHPNGKVRDHCHLTGKFRGLAHHHCNLNFQVSELFPVVFHNLRGYDSHFIIREIREEDYADIQVIPINREKFISFSLKFKDKDDKRNWGYRTWEMRFIDSLSFMSSSLEKLADNLDCKDFKYMMGFIKKYCQWETKPEEMYRLFHLIKQKGVYPYEYMDSFERFNERQLPLRDKFISKLSHETDNFKSLNDKQQKDLVKDYLHAKLVWNKFRCQNLGDYHDLYLQSDVYLLADIFERFRSISLDKFGLDPCHYYTLPGLGWDAMLKHTGVKLHLFNDSEKDMYLMMEQAKIGGISGTGGKRFARANNKYLEDYDNTKKSNYIIYGDANGLYSWAMSQKLPIDSFKWVVPSMFDLQKAMDKCDGDIGYFIEGDFHIPKELHDKFNDYPCFPENIHVREDMLSPYQKQMRKSIEIITNEKEKEKHTDSKIGKLIPNLLPKKNHIIHIKTLRLFLELGCKVDKINRVLQFRQEAWLKPYIDLCMTERAKANNSFEKEFWKLCCNAVYGKTLENVRNRVDVKLITDSNKAQKLINKPTLKNVPVMINDNGLMMIDISKTTVRLDKPVYAGIAILNLSKHLMYNFFYNILRKKYKDAVLLYTDTDSFIFEVFTDDFYQDLIQDKTFLDQWDLHEYKPEHRMFEGMNREETTALINKNKKKVGYFKDECKGLPIVEYVGIRAKCYSILQADDTQKNTGKGVKKAILSKISHQRYYNCIHHKFEPDKLVYQEKMNFIRTDIRHNVYGEEMTKTCLSSFDDKKYVLEDGIHQLSYGHYRIKMA